MGQIKDACLPQVKISESYNYIGTFLTFSCNLKCSYCINNFESQPRCVKYRHLSGKEWALGLNRIVSKSDLPITLQGGEPLLHKDFTYIVNNLSSGLKIDVLTNLCNKEIFNNINPERLKRKAPYASIRVSYHPEQMNLESLIEKILWMQEKGFYIGIWGVMHPLQKVKIKQAQKLCKKVGIDFRTKEFLGEYNGKMYGHYRYPDAVLGGNHEQVLCKTTELIIGPDGSVYRCTADLYEQRKPIGHILDADFKIEDKFRPCDWFGHCNPCDIKTKTNRFQQFGYSSVEIKI